MAAGKRLIMRAVLAAAAVALLAAPATASASGHEARIQDYQASWAHRALGLQYELGSDVPFRDAPWVGTHNSFNSIAEMGPTLSALDSNQKLDLVDQLRIDVRSLELDVHWFFRPNRGGYAPVVCHATEQHGGCTTEKTLGVVLEEIAGWLRRPANGDEVVLLYLEDHLDNETGYNTAARTVSRKLGGLLYRPPAGGCTELPLESLTRDDVRAAGAQVVAVSDCGIGSGWPSVIFDWSDHLEARPMGYRDFPDCGPDFTRAEYDGTLIRYFEDSTRLTNNAGTPDDGITPPTAAAMARCGVDLFGLDQLRPFDGRLQSLVWSWAPHRPREQGGECAVQVVNEALPHGRWANRRCDVPLPVACRTGATWIVPDAAVSARQAQEACTQVGAQWAVPRTGYEAQLLRLAMEAAGKPVVRLAYVLYRGDWLALDARG